MRFERVCVRDGTPVAWEDLVKGYEFEKGTSSCSRRKTLSVMRFSDELVEADSFEFPTADDVRSRELEMAKALVGNLAADWDPGKYTDQYRENLLRIIRGKMKGKDVTLAADEEPRQAEVVDLMERLCRSLAGAGRAPRAKATKRGKKPAKRRTRRAA